MYLLTKWESRTGEYLATKRSWSTNRAHRGPCSMSEGLYFRVRSDLNSVNKHFIIWALYAIHEHSEDEVWTKKLMYNMCFWYGPHTGFSQERVSE